MVVLTTFWSILAESLKNFSLKIRKNSEKKNKKTVSSAIFTLDTYIEFWEPCRRFLQKIQNDSEPKKIQATNCSSGHVEGSFDKLLKFFGHSLKIFCSKFEKFLKRKTKKNYFFRNFYSGHVDRFLRTMPKVSAENPKRFKTLEQKFKSQTNPLDTQKLVLTTSRSFLAESLKNFHSKSEKNSERKN